MGAGASLQEFKAEGKRICALSSTRTLTGLLLFSVADRIAMPDAASVLLPGVSAEALYVKTSSTSSASRCLRSCVSNYKAAFENFAGDMSPEFHEILEYLVESSYQAVQEIIAASRGITQHTWLRRSTAPFCRLPT